MFQRVDGSEESKAHSIEISFSSATWKNSEPASALSSELAVSSAPGGPTRQSSEARLPAGVAAPPPPRPRSLLRRSRRDGADGRGGARVGRCLAPEVGATAGREGEERL